MSDLRSVELKDISFEGTDGTRCDAFIQMVAEYATMLNRTLDDEWAAELVGMRLFGKALRWYSGLPEETQGSWKKLRRAMLRRWPSDEEDPISQPPSTSPSRLVPNSSTVPVPAAAPPQASVSSPTAPSVRRGYIRVISEDPHYSGYLSRHHGVYLNMSRTSDKADAVQVEFFPSDNLYEIKLLGMDSAPDSWLGLHWRNPPEFTTTSLSDGALVNLVRPQYGGLASPSKQMNGPVTAAAWMVGLDGAVLPFQPTTGRAQYPIDLYVSKNDHEMGFTLSYDPFLTRMEQLGYVSVICKAKLMFEAVPGTLQASFLIPPTAPAPAPVPFVGVPPAATSYMPMPGSLGPYPGVRPPPPPIIIPTPKEK